MLQFSSLQLELNEYPYFTGEITIFFVQSVRSATLSERYKTDSELAEGFMHTLGWNGQPLTTCK